jgi:hypothetical protein
MKEGRDRKEKEGREGERREKRKGMEKAYYIIY